MIRKGRLRLQHFDEDNNFLFREVDKVTNKVGALACTASFHMSLPAALQRVVSDHWIATHITYYSNCYYPFRPWTWSGVPLHRNG